MYILFFIVGVALLGFYRYVSVAQYETISLALKYANSLWFFIFAVYSFYTTKKRSKKDEQICVKFLFALFMALVSDVVIEVNFVGGLIMFIIVQMVFIAAYLDLGKYNLKTIIATAVFCVVLVLLEIIIPAINLKQFAVPIVIYLIIISISTVKAVAGLKVKTTGRTILAIAAILFFISNITIQFSVPGLGNVSEEVSQVLLTINNFTYYLSQMFVAFAMQKVIVEPKEQAAVVSSEEN